MTSELAYESTQTLDELASEVCGNLDLSEVPSLSPSAYAGMRKVIVARENGRVDVVDGFHRVAGLINWASENEIELADVEIDVVVAEGKSLIAAAAEPGAKQKEALKKIYKLAE